MLLLLVTLAARPAEAADVGSVITIERQGSAVIYEVEGKKKRGLDEVIAVLRERAQRTQIRPVDDTAVILTSKALSILEIQNLYSALQAYGFRDIRVLAFDANKERLQELKLAVQVLPFTADRTSLMKAIGKEN
jgi:hypothetical protein